MSCTELAGSAVARELSARVRDELADLRERFGVDPQLTIVSATDDPSAHAYRDSILKVAKRNDLRCGACNVASDESQDHLLEVVAELNRDQDVHGVIILQPLPPHIDRVTVADTLSPLKDVDGVTTFNAGRLMHADRDVLAPSTPAGGMLLLKHYEIPIEGQHAVVIGRSPVVGRPMALMLLAENATVSIAHSRTRDLAALSKQADILVAAAGKPGMITGDMVKRGATVIDFGVNFVDGKMLGDVDAESVSTVAGALTPVPGGTGRVTTMVLLRNTIKAARLQLNAGSSEHR